MNFEFNSALECDSVMDTTLLLLEVTFKVTLIGGVQCTIVTLDTSIIITILIEQFV